LALGSLSRQRAQLVLTSIAGRRSRSASPRTDRKAEPPAARRPGTDLGRIFFALSAETRRGILYLLEGREHSAGEIVSHFESSQPTISRHLMILKEAGLVTRRREGRHLFYRLSSDELARSVKQFFAEFV
jgi:DNA-binding transcriptional ArsR family regulator